MIHLSFYKKILFAGLLYVLNHEVSVHGRNTSYKYLGKSLSLSGEDPEQICEIIEEYEDLLSKISKCDLSLALKASAFNNMALAKIFHHFYNSRLGEESYGCCPYKNHLSIVWFV